MFGVLLPFPVTDLGICYVIAIFASDEIIHANFVAMLHKEEMLS